MLGRLQARAFLSNRMPIYRKTAVKKSRTIKSNTGPYSVLPSSAYLTKSFEKVSGENAATPAPILVGFQWVCRGSIAIDKQFEEEQKDDISIGKRFLLDYPKIC
jgi:hypothetical protein